MNRAERHLAAIAGHGFVADAAQRAAIVELAALADRLEAARRREAGLWHRVRVGLGRAPARLPVRGLYLWGGVGRGKTLLMDLFADDLGAGATRVHFHRLMQDVHARLRTLRDGGLTDPLATVAADLAAGTRVLCLDELYVGDIADAMLLGGLFEGLVAGGVTLVFTSNSPPSGLYRDGLQRSRFLPAIALLERATTVLEVDGGIDYRLRELERAPLYLEAGPAADGELAQRFATLAGSPGRVGGTLEIEGREVAVLRSHGGVTWFGFGALCAGPRGTADYIEIARRFHTVLVSDVPAFGPGADDEARRFIALIDEFYERGVKLVLSAAAPADRLYGGARLAFEFRRAASRLAEMQSHDYLSEPHRP
jgi:cell division protein ZapE